MPHPDAESRLVPSVLDRLIDMEPKVAAEVPESPARQLRHVKEALRRDLEWLLNTKRVFEAASGRSQLRVSVLTYGIPDVSALSLSHPSDRDRLRRVIEDAIDRFEPRLKQTSVRLVEGRKEDRSLHFHIDALLDVEPEPEAVGFDSVLQLHTKAFQVQDGQE